METKLGLCAIYMASVWIWIVVVGCKRRDKENSERTRSISVNSPRFHSKAIDSGDENHSPPVIHFPLNSPSKKESKTISVVRKNAKVSNYGSSEDLLALTKKNIEPLVNHVGDSSESGNIIVLGIAGGSGSGKTTLARAIYETLGEENITYITHDSYYKDLSHLPKSEREKQNFDHPDSLETSLLVQHVKALKAKQQVTVPTYDYSSHTRRHVNEVLPPRPIILIEGILIFHDPELYDLMDIKIYVDTDDDIRIIRRIQRDTVERSRTLKSVINQYINTVRPMHLQFVEPSKRNADIIVPVGLNSVALDLVVSKLKLALQSRYTD